jgi:hypothetical protein
MKMLENPSDADKTMRWEFKQATRAARPWIWRMYDHETGSVLKQSTGSFVTLYACIRDAAEHGYAAPPDVLQTMRDPNS